LSDDRAKLRRALCDAGRRLLDGGLITGTEGNLSVRLPDGGILITPGGRSKGLLVPEGMVELPRIDDPLADPDTAIAAARACRAPDGSGPSSEVGMHLALYQRPGVGAVVHAHPPHATAFAAVGSDLGPPLLKEQVMMLGEVPLLPYARPASAAVALAVAALPEGTRAFLMAGHGATAVGGDLEEAVVRMEVLERTAQVHWLARGLDPAAPPVEGLLDDGEQTQT
jgi:L-fuculose-phosphate aldolase